MKATLPVFLILGFIAGFADTATFIHLSGLFSSHVTGNFVVLAVSLARGTHDGEALKILAVPFFVIAVMAATFVHDRPRKEEAEKTLDRLLAPTAGVMLLLAAAIAFFYGARGSSTGYTVGDEVAAMIAVLAMGVQNALHRFASPLGPTTTVMTSNVTQMTVLASRALFGGKAPKPKAAPKPASLIGLASLALTFAVGCAVSAFLTLSLGLLSLALPGVLLIATAIWGSAENLSE